MLRSNGTTCSGVCNVSKANILFLWIGNNDVLGFCGMRWNRSITPSAGVAGVGFDATYDLLVNTLTWRGKGVVANIPYVNTLPFTTVPYKCCSLSAAQASCKFRICCV
jgi:hypothetical protein